MSGDDLAITLFLIAAALAVALTAITIMGWRQKVFVGGLWGAAIILFLCGIGWTWIKTVSSQKIVDVIALISANPMSYTVMALTLAVALAIFRAKERKSISSHETSSHIEVPAASELVARAYVLKELIPEIESLFVRPSEMFNASLRMISSSRIRGDTTQMTSYGQFKRQMKNWQDDIKFIEKIIEKKYARSISILQEISAVDILYHAAPHEQNFYNTDNTAPDDTRRNEWRCWFLQQTRAQEAIEKTVSEIRKELAEIESRLRGIAASAKN